MRGCLSVLVLAALFALGALWFGGPPIASTVLEATLTSGGFTADELDVTVETALPPRLVLGRADRVTIQARGVKWNGLEAESMALEMNDVDLFARSAGQTDGSFDGVVLLGPDDEPVVVSIDLNGPAEAATTTVRVDRQTVERIAKAAFEAEFGIKADAFELVPPNTIRMTVAGQSVSGRLEVFSDSGLTASSPLGPSVTLVAPEPSLPLTLTGLSVTGGGLVLTGTLDVNRLIR